MKLLINKLHVIILALAFLSIVSLGIFLYYRAENSVDKRLKNAIREMSLANAEKGCKEDVLATDECEKLKEQIEADSEKSSFEFVEWANKDCKDKNFSESQCEQHKENFIKNFKDDIELTAPFSNLDPQVRAKVEERAATACKMQNLSDEECRKTKIAMIKATQEKQVNIIKMINDLCFNTLTSDLECQNIKATQLEKFKNETLSGEK